MFLRIILPILTTIFCLQESLLERLMNFRLPEAVKVAAQGE